MMNEIERLAENLKPHIENAKGNEKAEAWVNVDGKLYRLTGGISTYTYLGGCVLCATTTGKPIFE